MERKRNWNELRKSKYPLKKGPRGGYYVPLFYVHTIQKGKNKGTRVKIYKDK